MTYNPLSVDEKVIIQNRVRANQALNLCIIMMVSDRDIHDRELGRLYQFLKEEKLFFDLVVSDEDLLERISSIQLERANLTLEELVKKYSKVKNIKNRALIFDLLDKVMIADGIFHEKEEEMIRLLKEFWS
jgi:uncharacterized tellurite resistance protein B-like protein